MSFNFSSLQPSGQHMAEDCASSREYMAVWALPWCGISANGSVRWLFSIPSSPPSFADYDERGRTSTLEVSNSESDDA